MNYQSKIVAAQEIQKKNHPSSAAWQQAHETIKNLVQQHQGIDIDGKASCKGGLNG